MDMNFEEYRLNTFNFWPGNAPITPAQLAKNGFYATGVFLEAKCHWCQVHIRDWEYGDQAEERHRQAQPLCPFLNNYDHCGNVPHVNVSLTNESDGPSTSADLSRPGDLFVETNRLATFKNWPNPNVSPISLAKAGFFYLNRSDEVKCAWCKGVIAKWEKGDNAFNEHQRFFPNCPRVMLGPLIEMASDGIRELGIQQFLPPIKPKYSSLDARLRTYTNWPIGHIQRSEALAQAGLYYQDVEDHVRCFHCNIGLRSWQKEDDPWFEHAKWYPECQFVQLVKGSKYVQEVLEISRRAAAQQPSQQPTSPAQAPKPMTIEEAMNTITVLQALEIGLDVGSVRSATQRQLEETGRPFGSVEALAKAIFGDNDDDEEREANENQRLQREVLRSLSSVIENGDFEPCTSAQASTTAVAAAAALSSAVTAASTAAAAATSSAPEGDVAMGRDSQAQPQQQQQLPSTSSGSAPVTDSFGVAAVASGSEGQCAGALIDGCAALSQAATHPILQSLEEENRQLREARLCKVCLDEEVGVVFLPCGHLVTCVQCAPGVPQCPLCRTEIKGYVRTFLA